jgi:hypothetical protein
MAQKRGGSGESMTRVSAFLRRDQVARLRERQRELGIPVAEQIRRAIDAALGISRKGGR